MAGITSGVVLLLLAISGFFLNHDNWKFIYTTTVSNHYLPEETIKLGSKLYNSYLIDTEQNNIQLLSGFRGVFRSNDSGKNYRQILDIPSYTLVDFNAVYYLATTEGMYISKDKGLHWESFALKGEVVTALSVDNKGILAVVDKAELVLLQFDGSVLDRSSVKIEKKELIHDISLGRLVRDVHYGRGLFDDGLSLLLNDFSTLWLILLASTGYVLWYLIQRIRKKKQYKKPLSFLLKIHTSSWVLVSVIPLILLALTGILLDHSQFFGKFLHQTTVPHKVLPPIYRTLKEDIWSVDLHDGVYRIGNRYGVYKSDDMKQWHLESKGFAYKMMHDDKRVFVSGMGAANRVYSENRWKTLENTPHMFKSINGEGESRTYFSSSSDMRLAKLKDTTLYTILLSIHDGSFFASWWVFVNDFVSVLLLILLYTGLRLWYKRIRVKFGYR